MAIKLSRYVPIFNFKANISAQKCFSDNIIFKYTTNIYLYVNKINTKVKNYFLK